MNELINIKLAKSKCEIKAKLREEITGDDWERWQRLSEFYAGFSENAEKNTNMILKMSREEYNTLVHDVLIDENSELIVYELVKQVPLSVSLPMIVDFFFVFKKLNNDMLVSLQTSGTNSKEFTEILKDSKIKTTQQE